MSDDLFQASFPIASRERGRVYVEARDRILKLQGEDRQRALGALEQASRDTIEWQTGLTAEILLGWMTHENDFRDCDRYAAGEIEGPKPMGGFTSKHRIDAVADLGPTVVPRVLERVWKIGEPGELERSALFGSLAALRDPRAVRPMIALIEADDTPPAEKGLAASALSQLGDPRALEVLQRMALDRRGDPESRATAIRCLGRLDAPGASQTLTRILGDATTSVEDRRAAAEALSRRPDPAVRQAVVAALERNEDRGTLVNLLRVLEVVGQTADLPAIQRLGERQPAMRKETQRTMEKVRSRH